MDLHLTETRDQLTEAELDALEESMTSMNYAMRIFDVPLVGDDRLALIEQAIGDLIIESRS